MTRAGYSAFRSVGYGSSGIEQVGCIYTAQGFEVDYIGVIWGKDLAYDLDGQSWVGNKNVSRDRSVKQSKTRFLQLVKNTYRVLLSRGMEGCFVCFLDKDTERFCSEPNGFTSGSHGREPQHFMANAEGSLPIVGLELKKIRRYWLKHLVANQGLSSFSRGDSMLPIISSEATSRTGVLIMPGSRSNAVHFRWSIGVWTGVTHPGRSLSKRAHS